MFEVHKFNIFVQNPWEDKRDKTVPDSLSPNQSIIVNVPKAFTYEKLLKQKPKLWNVIKIVIPKIIPHWKDVSRSLAFDEHTISAIESEARNIKECCEKLFLKWLNSNHGLTPKTWNTLFYCIKEIDELTAAAKEIETELQSICTSKIED